MPLYRKLFRTDEKNICLYEKYIVKFKDALNSGDIINESRQLNKDDVEGISNDANGEA